MNGENSLIPCHSDIWILVTDIFLFYVGVKCLDVQKELELVFFTRVLIQKHSLV